MNVRHEHCGHLEAARHVLRGNSLRTRLHVARQEFELLRLVSVMRYFVAGRHYIVSTFGTIYFTLGRRRKGAIDALPTQRSAMTIRLKVYLHSRRMITQIFKEFSKGDHRLSTCKQPELSGEFFVHGLHVLTGHKQERTTSNDPGSARYPT
jgi:hypothetical protein